MRLLTPLFLLLSLLLQSNVAEAETMRLGESIPNGMLSRIFQIRSAWDAGTCFVIDVDERQYLVTARHIVQEKTEDRKILQEIKEGDKISIFIQGAWIPKVVHPIFLQNKNIDAVALALDDVITPPIGTPVGSGGIFLGQKVFFLGFPFDLASRSKDRIDNIPFVKAGILSAIDSRNNNEGTVVYIDGHNNPGFSGGPVIFPNFNEGRQLQILAVISGYKAQPLIVEEVEVAIPDSTSSNSGVESAPKKKTKKLQIVRENTGIIVAYQLNELVEAIRSNPQGPKHVRPSPEVSI